MVGIQAMAAYFIIASVASAAFGFVLEMKIKSMESVVFGMSTPDRRKQKGPADKTQIGSGIHCRTERLRPVGDICSSGTDIYGYTLQAFIPEIADNPLLFLLRPYWAFRSVSVLKRFRSVLR